MHKVLEMVRDAARSSRGWIALGIVAPLGMLVVSGLMLVELRQDVWEKAEQTSQNLLQVIERDIARNFETYSLSIQAVIENLGKPGVAGASPDLRQLILFDRAATAKDLGVLLVLDENGDVTVESGSLPHRTGNYADRDYFKRHKADPDLSLHVSGPLTSRLSGERMIVLSRRMNKPDGSFGGVVLGTWKLAYFHRLFDKLSLGPQGAINLFHLDGTRIMRQPYRDGDIGGTIAGAATYERFLREGKGSFIADSARDGIRRHYAFTRVGDLPLILDVATSVNCIEQEWRDKALVISLVLVILCGMTIGLALLFVRELKRREAAEAKALKANAELSRLSLTDALTGLPNRRQFDQAFPQEWLRAQREGTPLSLLVVDADHFKRYNDRYGHRVGDEVLQGLGTSLASIVHRPTDRVYRVGGEEFAVLLPNTDAEGAQRIAGRVHQAVAGIQVRSVGIGAGSVTVSVGLGTAIPPSGAEEDHPILYEAADKALYEAKERGRNQTRQRHPYGMVGELRLVTQRNAAR